MVAVKIESGTATVHFKDAREGRSLIPAGSVKLMVGHSPWLGKGVKWSQMVELYESVYLGVGLDLLRMDGYLVLFQTDTYERSTVLPKNAALTVRLCSKGFELVDMKVWARQACNQFQLPFTQVLVFRPQGGSGNHSKLPGGFQWKGKKRMPYGKGVWDFPIKAGGIPSFPDCLCQLLVESFTEEGDLIFDPFAGRARLLGVASRLGRVAIGTEIDKALEEDIRENLLG